MYMVGQHFDQILKPVHLLVLQVFCPCFT